MFYQLILWSLCISVSFCSNKAKKDVKIITMKMVFLLVLLQLMFIRLFLIFRIFHAKFNIYLSLCAHMYVCGYVCVHAYITLNCVYQLGSQWSTTCLDMWLCRPRMSTCSGYQSGSRTDTNNVAYSSIVNF